MNDRFFIDTNVFVYSFDRNAPAKAKKAEQIIRQALKSQKGIVSYQVIQEFFNVALRRFETTMTASAAERYLATVFRPLLRVQSSLALYAEALRVFEKHTISWYDALMVAAAIQTECGTLLSEDLQHGQRFGAVRVVNPFL